MNELCAVRFSNAFSVLFKPAEENFEKCFDEILETFESEILGILIMNAENLAFFNACVKDPGLEEGACVVFKDASMTIISFHEDEQMIMSTADSTNMPNSIKELLLKAINRKINA